MRSKLRVSFVMCVWSIAALSLSAQSYLVPKATEKIFDVPDVTKANVVMHLETKDGKSLYTLQCHAMGYTGDPDFEYSGDFECRLSQFDHRSTYSTLLTEDLQQSRDWESRGRFFAADLRGACAQVPEFGASRSFRLRGMKLTLKVLDPSFKKDKLISLKLTVSVVPDSRARRKIAADVPLPTTGVPASCKLREYFIDPVTVAKAH